MLRRLLYAHNKPQSELFLVESFTTGNTIMFYTNLARILGATAVVCGVLGDSWQFNGTITVDSDTTNIITITVMNEGVHNYSILAKNNMFDDSHPFAPFSLSTTAGTPVTLAGSRFDYTTLTESQFLSFPPGTAWTRQFNVSEFLLPDPKLTVGASQCFVISLPPTLPVVLVDNLQPSQKLADIFFTGGMIDIPLGSIPLHHNISDPAGASQHNSSSGSSAAAASTSATVPAQASASIGQMNRATATSLNILSGGGGQPAGNTQGQGTASA